MGRTSRRPRTGSSLTVRLALALSLSLLLGAAVGCERTESDGPGAVKSEGKSAAKAAARSATRRGTAAARPTSATPNDKAGKATLPKPDNLPHLDPAPVVASVARRARILHDDGLKALSSGDFAAALSGFAGAVQLDPGRTEAHLDLARLYLRAGHKNVARGILLQLGSDLGTCGGCIEALSEAARDPKLRPLLDTPAGAKILAQLGKHSLAWEEWALQVSQSLLDGSGRQLPGFVHPRIPFTLVRSCPTCSNPERRQPERRELSGPRVAIKLASRFNTREQRFGGIPLKVQGKGKHQGRCVSWTVPSPVPVGTAALQRLCFRPISRDRAALTEVVIIYGRSQADLKRGTATQP